MTIEDDQDLDGLARVGRVVAEVAADARAQVEHTVVVTRDQPLVLTA